MEFGVWRESSLNRFWIFEFWIFREKEGESDIDKRELIKSSFPPLQVSRVLGNAGLNLLVNNAGVLINYHLHEDPDRQKIEDTMKANIVGPVLVSQVHFLDFRFLTVIVIFYFHLQASGKVLYICGPRDRIVSLIIVWVKYVERCCCGGN